MFLISPLFFYSILSKKKKKKKREKKKRKKKKKMITVSFYVLSSVVVILLIYLLKRTTKLLISKKIFCVPKKCKSRNVPLIDIQKGYYVNLIKYGPKDRKFITCIGIKLKHINVGRLVKSMSIMREYMQNPCYVLTDNNCLKYKILSQRDSTNQYANEKSFKNFDRLINHYPYTNNTDLFIDISHIIKGEDEKVVEFVQTKIINFGIDVHTGPGIRLGICKYGEDKHIAFSVANHLFVDGPYALFYWRVVATFYRLWFIPKWIVSMMIHHKYPLDKTQENFIKYIDKNYPETQKVKDVDYWKNALRDCNYKFDFGIPPKKKKMLEKDVGKRVYFEFNRELYELVKKIVRGNETTGFIVLYAIYNCWMRMVFSKKDICSSYATSILPKNTFLCGLYATPMFMRVKFNENSTLTDIVNIVSNKRRVERNMKLLSFNRIVNDLKDYNITLPNIIFGLTVFEATGIDFGSGVEVDVANIQNYGEILHDFGFLYQEVHKKKIIRFCFEFKLRIFEEYIVNNFASSFVHFAEKLLKNPTKIITSIELLDEEQYSKQIITWNPKVKAGSVKKQELTIPLMFEHAVKTNPDKIAVQFRDEKLTYKELDDKSNKFANLLRNKRKVVPNVFIGVIFKKSIQMIIAIIGILKAGGVYLPIEHTLPKKRIEYILNNTKCSCVVIDKSLFGKFKFIDSNVVKKLKLSESKDFSPIFYSNMVGLKSNDLAYVIYTSGSTGKSKGVLVEHKSLVNTCIGLKDRLRLITKDSFAFYLSPSFDAHIVDVFPTLVYGLTLVVIPEDIRLHPKRLLNHFKKYNVDGCNMVPSILEMLPDNVDSSYVNTIVVGGESIKKDVMNIWLKIVDNFYNAYGPTECAVCTHMKRFEKGDIPNNIGKPLTNVQHYILNKNLNPVIIGMPGELCIGGPGVARGYLNDEKLSEKKFVKNKFRNKGVLYRTGDICRFTDTGDVIFIGREDFQVKINGCRTELGEIETKIKDMSCIKDCVVLLEKEKEKGKQMLYSFVIPKEEYKKRLIRFECNNKVSAWKKFVDQMNYDYKNIKDPTFNIKGWKSSYTGKNIAEKEMKEQFNDIIYQINCLNPSSDKCVLEIGCGTGIITSVVAKLSSEYVATDFSKIAIEYVNKLKGNYKELDHITTLIRDADNFNGIKERHFDLVVINSVIQYFPSVNYLTDVLKKCVNATKEGGRVFIGDVRNLELLKLFHLSVQLSKPSSHYPNEIIESLLARVERSLEMNEELVVDPQFFYILSRDIDRISHVQIQPKRGRFDNEFTNFRYNVIIHVSDYDVKYIPDKSIIWFDFSNLEKKEIKNIDNIDKSSWIELKTSFGNELDNEWYKYKHTTNESLMEEEEKLTWDEFVIKFKKKVANYEALSYFGDVIKLLKDNKLVVGIKNVVDSRLFKERHLFNAIEINGLEKESVEKLEKYQKEMIFNHENKFKHVHPDTFVQLGFDYGYSVDICYKEYDKGIYDVIIFKDYCLLPKFEVKIEQISYQRLVNLSRISIYDKQMFGKDIISNLKKTLPKYMIPSKIKVVDEFPINKQGKIDRNKLLLYQLDETNQKKIVAPSTITEKAIFGIIKDVTSREIGALDDFNESGISSIVTQTMLTRINTLFEVNIQLQEVMAAPTIFQLASFVEKKKREMKQRIVESEKIEIKVEEQIEGRLGFRQVFYGETKSII